MIDKKVSGYLGIVVLIGCFLVLFGWNFELELFFIPVPESPSITPFTSLLIGLLAICLIILSLEKAHKGIVIVLAVFAILLSLWLGLKYILRLPSDIEFLWMRGTLESRFSIYHGRPSPRSLISVVLIALALLASVLSSRNKEKMVTTFALLAWIIPWLALFGYASNSNPFFEFDELPRIGVSLISAIFYLFLITGLVWLNPQTGIAGLFRSSFMGGRLTRILIPVAVIGPLLMSWISQYMTMSTDSVNALYINWGLASLVFIGLVLIGGSTINEQDFKLVKSQQRLKQFLDVAPDAMIFVNEEGTISLSNQQMERLFGYTKDELSSMKVEQLIPGRFGGKHREHRKKFGQDPKMRSMGAGMELIGLKKGGLEFPVEVSLSPIETEEGVLVSAAIRDITQSKEVERKIIELNHDLERRAEEVLRSNKELEAFSYSVSHDLRAPLRAIAGFGNKLVKKHSDQLDEEGKRVVSVMIKNTHRMGQLIDDILMYSRISRSGITFTKLNLHDMILETYQRLMEGEPERNVIFDIAEIPPIYGDRATIRQVLINLISNALKYTRTREQANIAVGSQEGKDGIIIFIKDNGVGFDTRHMDKIFGVFQRLHGDEEFEGNGVGLAIVQRIIQRHNGKVWAESELEKGSTFYFQIPHNIRA
ncbi:MAG: PAS domain S-box protein [Cyclobacteriaceae bacterium]|nr:PAS domain S-box protein [Cyclobacteriaceae bacterium SS2]